MSILKFEEIDTLLETVRFHKKTKIANFFILKIDDLKSGAIEYMPPCQKDFYQLSFILNVSEKTCININKTETKPANNILHILSPEHIASWSRNEKLAGYIIYFKRSFLHFHHGDLKDYFTYFDTTKDNSFLLSKESSSLLLEDFEKIYNEHEKNALYQYEIIQSHLLAFLFKIKGLEELKENTKDLSKKEHLVLKFKNLVNNCFWKNLKVKIYAQKLNVSVNYLNIAMKEVEQLTAKEFISHKMISEAKYRLRCTSLNITDISFDLGFEEPTHFIRFFKKHTGFTPKKFRVQV